MIVPKKLKKDDIIATVSTSAWLAWLFPHRYEYGVQQLEEVFQVKVLEMKHTLDNIRQVYKNVQARAQDLMDAFADPKVKWIISTIWWEDSIRILPYIDFDIIKNNPKIYMWYSDSTITHFICHKAWLRSYYGPSIMAGFAENAWLFSYMEDSIRKNLFSNEVVWEIKANEDGRTNEFSDRANEKNQNISRKLQENTPWRLLQWSWKAEWELLWWCLDTFPFMRWTSIWPDAEYRKWKILFFEFSEEQISESSCERILRTLWVQWVLQNLNWIIVGRAQDNKIYDKNIQKIVKWEFGLCELPIITNLDFGHTDPMFVIPYWAKMTLDCDEIRIFINESSTR